MPRSILENGILVFLLAWVSGVAGGLIAHIPLFHATLLAAVSAIVAAFAYMVYLYVLKAHAMTKKASAYTPSQLEQAGITALVIFFFVLVSLMYQTGQGVTESNFLMALLPALLAGIAAFAGVLGIQLPS